MSLEFNSSLREHRQGQSDCLGWMWRIGVCGRLLCTLRCHLGWGWLAGNAARSQLLLLDIVLGLPRLAVIELAWRTKYEHKALLWHCPEADWPRCPTEASKARLRVCGVVGPRAGRA